MNQPTHQKRPYKARCVQWVGINTEEIVSLLKDVQPWGDYLMYRYPNGVGTLRMGDWVVVGENGQVKCYTDAVFRIKYEKLSA